MPDKADWVPLIARGWESYHKSFHSGRMHLADALSCFREAEDMLRAAADHEHLPLALDGKGAVLHAFGNIRDLRLALDCYDEEISLLKAHASPKEVLEAVSSYQAVLRDLALADAPSAFELIQKGLKMGEEAIDTASRLRDERVLAWVSQTTADLCVILSRIDLRCSREHLGVALDLYRGARDLWERVARLSSGLGAREAAEARALSLLGMADVHIRLGNLDAAEELLDEARSVYLRIGASSYQMGHVQSLYGSLALARGDRETAARLLKDAHDTFKGLGYDPVGVRHQRR